MPMNEPTMIHLTIPPSAWTRCGLAADGADADGRLLACVVVFGVPHHLEAVPVVYRDGLQEGADSPSAARLAGLADEYECCFSTVAITLDGVTRDYCLFLAPHGD